MGFLSRPQKFVLAATGLLLALIAAKPGGSEERFDIVIRGGKVVDGTLPPRITISNPRR